MMYQEKVKIISNNLIIKNYFKIILETTNISSKACPGQFVEIKVSDTNDPLLRRPFSTHRISGLNIEILYEVLGKGTEILSQKKQGEFLDIIGPLGNGFSCQSPISNHQSAILVAGGMGVAPLIFLAEKLAERKTKSEKRKTIILIGAKTKNHILCENEFKNFGCEVQIATDDGSRGFKGYVSKLLEKKLLTINYELLTIYACGPKPMLKEIALLSKKYNIPAQISLESYMACGFGACLGCAVKTITGYKMACSDGPVFNAKEILWE